MGRPIASDYEEKRDALLGAATRVFAEHGYDRASLNDVARAGGVSKAALYHYFENKDDILFSILDRHLSGLLAHVLAIENDGEDAERYFIRVIEAVLVFYRGNDDVHELHMQNLKYVDHERQLILRGYMRELVAHIGALIRALRPEIFEGDEEKLRHAVMSLFGMLNWYYTWNAGRGVEGRKHYARFAANMIIGGVRGL